MYYVPGKTHKQKTNRRVVRNSKGIQGDDSHTRLVTGRLAQPLGDTGCNVDHPSKQSVHVPTKPVNSTPRKVSFKYTNHGLRDSQPSKQVYGCLYGKEYNN